MKRDRMQREILDNQIRLKMNEGKDTELFSEVEKRRFSMSKEGKRCLILGIILVVVLILSVFFVVESLSMYTSPAIMSETVMRRVSDLVDILSGNRSQSQIHWFIFQFISAAVAGIMLSLAGICFQSTFQNPMASPTMLGVQSGGTIGSLIYCTFFFVPMISPMLSMGSSNGLDLLMVEYENMSMFQKVGQYFFTLAGCVIVVIIVMLMAKVAGRGKIATVPLMVGGTIFSSCVSKIINLVEYYETITGADESIIEEVQSMQSGTFTPIWQPLIMVCFLITAVPPIILALVGRNRLNVMTYGEEEARALGVSIRTTRVYYIVVSTLLTASVIAFCGNIAFVGLIVPHFARFIVGNDFRHLVPASAFLGGIFMLVAWDVSYSVSMVVNTGMIVSVLGSVLFAVFMIVYRRRGNADWA